MAILNEARTRSSSFLFGAFVTTVALAAFSLPAAASLGDGVDSITLDQQQMNATVQTAQVGSYTVYTLTSPSGTVVREYLSSGGVVFAVAWQGPFVPSMQQILDTYFQAYSSAANLQRESHVGRRPLNIQQPGLVVQTGGHMRDYFGRAYVPSLLPSGVNPNDVR